MIKVALAIYGGIAVLIGIRLWFVANKVAKKISNDLKPAQFFQSLIVDSMMWPYYLLWFGIKQFVEELK